MNIVVITAAGFGTRFGNGIPKQFVKVCGKPILLHTLEVFERHPMIDAIIVVCLKSWIDRLNLIVQKSGLNKVVGIVEGGAEVQQSIYNGLCAADEWVNNLNADTEPSDREHIVLIHDGVRPLVSPDLIADNIMDTRKFGNSITVAPSSETFFIKENDKQRLIPRENVHIARAPQCFYLKNILSLFEQAKADGREDFKDCCSILCEYGIPFHETIGESSNIKMTYPSDLFMLQAIIQYSSEIEHLK